MTIPVGGWLTARLGQASLAAGPGNAAIRQMSRSNRLAVIGTGVWILERDAVRYMLKDAYGEVTKHVSAAAMRGLTSALTATPLAGSSRRRLSKLQFRDKLEQWVHAHSTSLLEAATLLRDSRASGAEKSAAAAAMREVPFIARSPRASTVRQPARAAEMIQLSLWMGYMFEMDYLMTSDAQPTDHGRHMAWRRAGGIAAVPGGREYPAERTPDRVSLSGGRRIGYTYPGNVVIERVDDLPRRHVGGPFLLGKHALGSSWFERSDGFDAGELIRARNALRTLAMRYGPAR